MQLLLGGSLKHLCGLWGIDVPCRTAHVQEQAHPDPNTDFSVAAAKRKPKKWRRQGPGQLLLLLPLITEALVLNLFGLAGHWTRTLTPTPTCTTRSLLAGPRSSQGPAPTGTFADLCAACGVLRGVVFCCSGFFFSVGSGLQDKGCRHRDAALWP